jgi:hypothetical protein
MKGSYVWMLRLARTCDDVLNVLNDTFPLPFHSAISISGGHPGTHVESQI